MKLKPHGKDLTQGLQHCIFQCKITSKFTSLKLIIKFYFQNVLNKFLSESSRVSDCATIEITGNRMLV